MAKKEALVRQFYHDVWNNHGNPDIAEELFASEYTVHDPAFGTIQAAPQWQKDGAKGFRSAFPDNLLQITFTLSSEDMVAARWTITGIQKGKFRGYEPSNKKVEFSGINIFRFGDAGKIVELWNHRDDLSLIEQISGRKMAEHTSYRER